jgi:ubiquinol-cytochrome c reductase cytochrome b subunit
LIPGLLLALITAHMLLLVYHKHTQWPGPGRTNHNVVGYPLLPVYAAKAGGFFFIVFGVTALMGGLLTINPVWLFGPYDPSKVTAGSQPDWYMGWPDGLLRIMPGLESHIFGHTISWNVMVPILLVPPLMLTILILLPFLESWITGDKRDHHLLQRPRNAPTRTAVMVALMTFYGLSWAAGGNDLIAITLDLSINQITYFMRAAVFLGPVLAFIITKRWCISLQRKDEEVLLHGYETGIIMRSPEGGYSERHLPISEARAFTMTARDRDPDVAELHAAADGTDANGLEPKRSPLAGIRRRLQTTMYADNVQKPTAEELEAGHHHAEHEHELQSAMEGVSADGHQFDGHHLVEDEALRGQH